MRDLDIVLHNELCMPKKGSKEAAGIDLRLCLDSAAGFTPLAPGESLHFSTGVKVKIPRGWVGLLLPRSGLGTKFKIRLDNTVGVIDSDYIGWIQAFITNTGHETAFLGDYDRVCQLVIVPHYEFKGFNIVKELPDTERGSSGFGSSGKM